MEFKAPALICVYGTLRKGHGNHRIIEDCKYLGEFHTEPIFLMLSLGGFPGLFFNGEDSILCEVFKIEDDNTLRRLDRLEGYPSFYNRTQIETPWGLAWVYYLEEKDRYSNLGRVESGDWNKYVKENNRY
jgi:gamma-glutamylcyclotransferase (GGCT)/AIG2-like uncharacterized protein YtfP